MQSQRRTFRNTLSVMITLSLAFPLLDASAAAKKESAAQPKDALQKSVEGDSSSNAKPETAAKSKVKSQAKNQTKKLSGQSANQYVDNLTVKTMNAGDWNATAARLESLLAQQKIGTLVTLSSTARIKRSYLQAWLAFAYMYVGKADKTAAVLKTVEGEDEGASKVVANSKDDNDQVRLALCENVVRAMNEIAEGHFDKALAFMQSLPADSPVLSTDTLYNYTLACIAGKKGQADKACELSRKAYEGDKRFAWALRTIAFLQQKWLKNNQAAEGVLVETLKAEPQLTEARDMLIDVKLARNDFDGALDTALSGIKLSPKSASAHFRLAQIYIQQWRLREALDQLDKAIALEQTAKYYRNRSTVKRLRGDIAGALSDQTKAVELSKEKSFELAELANLNVTAGNTNKAIDNLKEALAGDPENAPVREKLYKLLVSEKRYTDLAEEYKDQITRHPKTAALHLGYANVLMALGEEEKAVQEFVEAANLNQTDPTPHRALGAYYIQKRMFSKAAKEYTRALNIVPTSIKDMVSLGFCYAEDDDYMKAEAAFVTAMAVQQLSPSASPDDPGRVDVMRSLASLLFEEGRYGDAATQFENLVVDYKDKGATVDDAFMLAKCKLLRDQTETAARNMMAVFEVIPAERKDAFRLGMAEALVDAGMPALAREELNKLPEDSRKSNYLYVLYSASVLRLEDKPKEALALIEQVSADLPGLKESNPHLASRLLVERARLELLLGETDKAKASAQEAYAVYDKSYPALLMAAELAIKGGDHKSAVEYARRALQLNPYYAPAYLLIGGAQTESKDAAERKEGLENLKKAVELYPGWLSGRRALLKAYEKASLKEEAKKEASVIAELEAKSKER